MLEAEGKLRERERAYRLEHATRLMEEVEALNRHRLALLVVLSEPKRNALVGFGAAGLDQATAEVSQVVLVLRYHQWATTSWLRSVVRGDRIGGSALGATAVALSWLLPIAAFVWWRRRADRSVASWQEVAQKAHEKRTRSRDPSRLARLVGFLGRLRRPLEWLLLVWAVFALLPDAVEKLLEVQIVQEILVWTFGAMLVVYAVDALSRTELPLAGRADTGPLRLRSLRLVGLVVVVFALVLRITARLVGEGTIYSWVFRTCWFAGLPVALVLVAWWRAVIFKRLARGRRKSALAAWAAGRQAGWASFVAASVGGVYLVGCAILRALRSYVGRFDVTRRALAYWFRREVTKQAATRAETRELGRLPDETWRALHPETSSGRFVESVADDEVADIVKRIEAPGGGLFAVVGERGGGKSTILQRIAEHGPDVTFVGCPPGGIDALRGEIAAALGSARRRAFPRSALGSTREARTALS